jgi:heme exporter protein D
VLGGVVMTAAAVPSYRATLKPGQVETIFDFGFFRPVAYGVVRLVMPTSITPNQLTAMSIAAGLAGAALLRFDDPLVTAAGCTLMLVYGVLDCADGQLARARGTSSRLGRILDGMSDYVVGVASGVALSLRLADAMGTPGAILAAAGLASVVLQGTLFDQFKNRYLRRSDSVYREGDDLEETLAAIEALKKEGASPVVVGLHHVYATFLRVQNLASGAREAAPTPERARAYGERLAAVARAAAYLGPSTHLVLLASFLAAGRLDLYIWLRLVAGNAALVALLVERWRRERAIDQDFASTARKRGSGATGSSAASGS